MEYLQQDRKVYVSALSELFQVTEETVRRDLEKLEKEGKLNRSYGGAVLKEHTIEDISFPKRTSINLQSKQKIANKAANLINDGDTLMVDSSTTSLVLMNLLTNKQDLTIITNSVKLVYDFINSNFNIISSGGSLRSHSFALTGAAANSALSNYFVDIAIISCKGLCMDKGIMESNEAESELKQKMVNQAEKVLLLADHSKFDKTAFTKTLDFNSIHYVVTDMEPSLEWLEFFKTHNIKVIY